MQIFHYKCAAPEAETEKAYKVFNGKNFSYLAKSQMSDVSITPDDVMTFTSSAWFGRLHPWLTNVENSDTSEV